MNEDYLDGLSLMEITQIEEFINAYGKNTTEFYRALDLKGKVANEKKGDKHAIYLTKDDDEKIKPGAVEMHNHPRAGSCFSPEDIVTCKKHRSRMIVVNSYGDIFYLKPKNDDKLRTDILFLEQLRHEYYKGEIYESYSEELKKAIREYNSYDEKGKRKNRKLYYYIQRESSVEIVKQLAKRYNFTFRRLKMKK